MPVPPLAAIQSALREGVRPFAVPLGPFLAYFDRHSQNPFRNYAIPDDGAVPTAADVAALVSAFRDRGRLPRLEYVAPAPAVDRALAAAGFTVDLRLPLMTLAGAELIGPAPCEHLTVVLAEREDDLWAAARIQHHAYGEGEAGEPDVRRLRSTIDAGGTVALARWDGTPVGSGLSTPVANGLCEIAAVGVEWSVRRRGVASAVGAELSRAVLTAGATPYLQTESANEQRLYGRLGYRAVGELVASSLPS